MPKAKFVPILTEELRASVEEHRAVQVAIDAEMKRLRPDYEAIATKKREKLRLKDVVWGLFKMLPPSQFSPISPALFVMNDLELARECKSRARDVGRTNLRVGPTSTELAKKRADLRDVELEIDRRALEKIFAAAEEEVAAESVAA